MTEETLEPLPLLQIGSKRPWNERLSACNGCDRCGDRCVSGYPISLWEYRRIRRYLAQQNADERERVAAQDKNAPWPGAPKFTYEACRFRDLEKGQCSIYPVRPLVCRLFGHVEWLPCPVGTIREAAPGGVSLMQWYGRRELHTFEEWEAREFEAGEGDALESHMSAASLTESPNAAGD